MSITVYSRIWSCRHELAGEINFCCYSHFSAECTVMSTLRILAIFKENKIQISLMLPFRSQATDLTAAL